MKTKIVLLSILLSYGLILNAQKTYVPDDNFEQALIDRGLDDAMDDSVRTVFIQDVWKLTIPGLSIEDLTGIEDFSNLRELDCSNNQIASLDLSQNSLMYELDCSSNGMTDLQTGPSDDMNELICSDNLLTSLDVSAHTWMMTLQCDSNLLVSLDIRQVRPLHFLSCRSNNLVRLDLRNGNNEGLLDLLATDNLLTCIDVDDELAVHYWDVDPQVVYSNDCESHVISIPDINFEMALIDLGYDSDGILNHQILHFDAVAITSLDISYPLSNPSLPNVLHPISDLSGIEYFVNLESLNCSGNQLENFDLSEHRKLSALRCNENSLTHLDVSMNSLLTTLECSQNLLRHIDVSINTHLTALACDQNRLVSLNVRNGNNSNFVQMNANGNPDLSCISVDDETLAHDPPVWIVDPGLDFSNNCVELINFIINEVDADTEGLDNKEFIEIYDGGIGYSALSGHCVVLFNGSTDESYNAFDLDGYLTDAAGYFVLGNSTVSNVSLIFPENGLQNGADAVALYRLPASEFPEGTFVRSDDLLDALVYDTDDYDDYELITILHPDQSQINENELNNKEYHSLQRIPNGEGGARITSTYLQSFPTPGAPNFDSNSIIDIPDNQFEQALIELGIDSDQVINQQINREDALMAMALDISDRDIADLTGIEAFVNLASLICSGNRIESLDLSDNPNLQLVDCSSNSLVNLNMQNGENNNISAFDATDNPLLFCIQVDSEDDARAGLAPYDNWLTDPATNYAGYCELQMAIDFESGWNWFSVNVLTQDMSLGNLLSCASNNDYIKSQTESATYYEGYGWYGSLEDAGGLDPRSLYKIKAISPCGIDYSGMPVHTSVTPIHIAAGWNWIAYLSQCPLSVESVLGSMSLITEDYIKNQTESATYYEGHGWYGSLNSLLPKEGYMLRKGTEDELIFPYCYPDPAIAMKGSVVKDWQRGSGLNPNHFEYSGTVTAKIFLNGDAAGGKEDLLMAYVGDQLRGVMGGIYFEPANTFTYPIMVYSNLASGEELTFRYYDSESDRTYPCDQTLVFTKDMIEANAFETFNLHVNSSLDVDDIAKPAGNSLNAYPNPFSEQIRIDYTIYEESTIKLTVCDMLGRVVAHLDEQKLDPGSYFCTWDALLYPEGSYLVKLSTEYSSLMKKIILLR